MKLLFSFFIFVTIGISFARPSYSDGPEAARWLVSSSRWGTIATSGKYSNKDIQPIPFSSVISFSDGIGSAVDRRNSTGTPYFYLPDIGTITKDIKRYNGVSLTLSEQSEAFDGKCIDIDPESPLCRHLTISGKIIPVDINSKEFQFAKEALFSKHPEMKYWPSEHGWNVYKLDIIRIFLIDYFGGAKIILPKEYYAVKFEGTPALRGKYLDQWD